MIYADLKADTENDNSNRGDKTTKICKENPVGNGYFIVSELNVVSKSYK